MLPLPLVAMPMPALLLVQLTAPDGVDVNVIPVTVAFARPPPQTVCEFPPPPTTLTVGVAFTVILTILVFTQLLASVPVTV